MKITGIQDLPTLSGIDDKENINCLMFVCIALYTLVDLYLHIKDSVNHKINIPDLTEFQN